MNLKKQCLMNEARHKKTHIVWVHFHEISTTDKCIETESILVVVRGWEKGGIENDLIDIGFPSGWWRSSAIRKSCTIL